ncbi:MAG: hypothetical protein KDB94_02100 [Acidobacteria bacterium]|nr:hypothetical protein [Acidobacteriota bacterium]MCB9378650.1 hypothetical protein [Holophagales bacterium]
MHETIELPRYPDVQVTLRSRNRWAVAAAIRIALRRAGKERREIDRFLAEALAEEDPRAFREACRRWVVLRPTA